MKRAHLCLLVAACLLLAANLLIVVLLDRDRPVYGQSVGAESGQFILATVISPSGSRPAVYVLDTESKILASYETTTSAGIELRGLRRLEWDLSGEIQEWPDAALVRSSAVRRVQEKVESLRK